MTAVVGTQGSSLENVSHSLRQGAGKLFNLPLNAVRRLTASCEGVKNYLVRDGEARAAAAYRIGHDVGTAARRAGHWLRHEFPTIAKREIPWAVPCAALTLAVKASLVGSGVMASGGMTGFAASLAVGAVTTTAFRAVRNRMTADEAYQNMAAARQGSLASHFSRTARLTPLFMRHAYGALAHDGLLKNATFWKKVAMNAAFGGACVGLMEASGLSHAIGNVMRSAIGNAHAGDAGSLGYGPGALEQPTYGSGPAETTGGSGKLEMYAPAASNPPAAPELPKLELVSPTKIHGGAVPVAPEDIAAHAPPIAPTDVQSQVRALLESGELDKKTAQAAQALLKAPESGQRLKDLAYYLLNKEHNTQTALEFYHLAAEAGNKQALADLAYLKSKGIGLPAQPAPPVTSIVDSGSPQPGFGNAGEVRAGWAHSGEPLQQATAPAPTEAPSVPHGKLAAECHLSPMQLHPNHDGTKNVIIENINCKIYNQTMMPGQKVLVTTYQAGSQDFELDRSGSSNTLAFLTGSQHPTILTATDSRTSRLGFAVDKLTRIWKSAMIESQNVVAGFGTKFSFGPIGPAFN